MPNAGFEELAADGRTPKGWTIEIMPQGSAVVDADATDVLTGRRSLQIATADADGRRDGLFATDSGAGRGHVSRRTGLSPGRLQRRRSSRQVRGSLLCGWGDLAGCEPKSGRRRPTAASLRSDAVGSARRPPTGAAHRPFCENLDHCWATTAGNKSARRFPRRCGSTPFNCGSILPPPTPDWAKRETAYIVEGGKEETRLLSYFVGIDNAFQHMRGGGGRGSSTIRRPSAARR